MIMNEPNSQFKFPRFRCRMSLNQMEFLRGSRKRVKVLKWSKKWCNWWKLFIKFVDVKTCVSVENRPKQKRSFHNEKVRTARMDLMFLILFPILFFIFNIVYWVGFLYVVPETETEGTVEWCSVCGTLGQKKLVVILRNTIPIWGFTNKCIHPQNYVFISFYWRLETFCSIEIG